MNQSQSPWMTIGETAKHIRMSVGFLRKCVRQRSVPFARIGTKALRFRREDIDRWLEARVNNDTRSQNCSASLDTNAKSDAPSRKSSPQLCDFRRG